MAGRYRKIETRIWNDAKFQSLTERGKLVFMFLLTHPNMTMLGAMRATVPGLAAEIQIEPEGFREAFQEVLRKGMAKHDPSASFLWLPNFLKYNKPESPNVVKAWPDAWEMLPECELKSLLANLLKAFVEGLTEGFQEAFTEAFGKTWPNQEPEPEPKPEPDLKATPPPTPSPKSGGGADFQTFKQQLKIDLATAHLNGKHHGPDPYDEFFRDAQLIAIEDGRVILTSPTPEQLAEGLRKFNGRLVKTYRKVSGLDVSFQVMDSARGMP